MAHMYVRHHDGAVNWRHGGIAGQFHCPLPTAAHVHVGCTTARSGTLALDYLGGAVAALAEGRATTAFCPEGRATTAHGYAHCPQARVSAQCIASGGRGEEFCPPLPTAPWPEGKTEKSRQCIAIRPTATILRVDWCQVTRQELHRPLPPGSEVVYCGRSTAHCPQAVRQCIAGVALPTAPRQ